MNQSEGRGLASPVADVTEYVECLLVAGGGRRVVPGQPLRGNQLVEGIALADPVNASRYSSSARRAAATAAGYGGLE